MEKSDAAVQAEARFAGVSRINIEGASNGFGEGFVRVAKDDRVGLLELETASDDFIRRRDVDDVVNQESPFSQPDALRLLEVQAGVVVPKHGCHRGNGFQSDDDRGGADVASMEDVRDALEKLEDSRIEKAVGVGDDADLHGAEARLVQAGVS